MQKYLNIDPTDGSAPQENSGLLNALGDDESGLSTPSLAMQALAAGPGTPHHATNHSPNFGGSTHGGGLANINTAQGANAVGPNTGTGAGAGYTPPANTFSAYPEAGEDSVSNPMAQAGARLPTPTRTAATPAQGPPAPAAKAKKAMKEPKSMRSST